jgi:hypothetical protein
MPTGWTKISVIYCCIKVINCTICCLESCLIIVVPAVGSSYRIPPIVIICYVEDCSPISIFCGFKVLPKPALGTYRNRVVVVPINIRYRTTIWNLNCSKCNLIPIRSSCIVALNPTHKKGWDSFLCFPLEISPQTINIAASPLKRRHKILNPHR